MLLGGEAALANIVYNVDRTVGMGSVTGTITTDGNTGTLGLGDFLAWNLTLNGAPVNNTDSVIWGDPFGDVTATATDLYFNFSGSTGDIIFQEGESSGSHYYCDQAGATACFQGESDVPLTTRTPPRKSWAEPEPRSSVQWAAQSRSLRPGR